MRKTLAIPVLAALFLSLSFPASATAAAPDNADALMVAKSVYESADPAKAYNSLDPASKALLVDGISLTEQTVTTTTSKISPAQARLAFERGGQSLAAYDVCYSRSAQGAGKNVLGGVLYRYYTTLVYCATGGQIKTASWRGNTGTVHFPGWWYDGQVTQATSFTARSVAGFAQFRFHSGPIQNIPVQNVYPCLQTRVDSAGVQSVSSSCYA